MTSGTDDGLPPSHQNRFQNGREQAAGNGRSAVVGTAALPRVHSDMETQIHHIEQEAYCSVLRAFKAQSDAISWVSATDFHNFLLTRHFHLHNQWLSPA